MSRAEQPKDGPTCYLHGDLPAKRRQRYPGQTQCTAIGRDGKRCRMVVDAKGRVREIEGSDVEDVLSVYSKVRETILLRQSPWVSGSFYLTLFLIVVSALLVAGHLLKIWAVPIIVVGGLLGTSILGAFQLRHDDKLSEKGFLRLMIVAVRRLPVSATTSAPDEEQR